MTLVFSVTGVIGAYFVTAWAGSMFSSDAPQTKRWCVSNGAGESV